MPFSGNDNTHTLKITLPNGSTETQTYHEVITGRKTVVNGTTQEANGGVETWTSVKIKIGPTTTAGGRRTSQSFVGLISCQGRFSNSSRSASSRTN